MTHSTPTSKDHSWKDRSCSTGSTVASTSTLLATVQAREAERTSLPLMGVRVTDTFLLVFAPKSLQIGIQLWYLDGLQSMGGFSIYI